MITPPVLLATAVGVVLGTLVALAVSAARERARQALEKQGAQGEASRILQRASEEAENIKKAGKIIAGMIINTQRGTKHSLGLK